RLSDGCGLAGAGQVLCGRCGRGGTGGVAAGGDRGPPVPLGPGSQAGAAGRRAAVRAGRRGSGDARAVDPLAGPARRARRRGRTGTVSEFDEVNRALEARGFTRMEFELQRIESLLDLLGMPQRAYPSIHITGTNGKTSTARMIDALLRAHGLRTGRYTSPHLA